MGQDYTVVGEQVNAVMLAGGAVSGSLSVATASGTSIPTNARVLRVTCTAATTAGSCTLSTGSVDGQTIFIIN